MAGKPVMEGKGCLFKKFAGIDAFDIELDESDPDKPIDTIARMEPTFGGINLEDIKAPECFYIGSLCPAHQRAQAGRNHRGADIFLGLSAGGVLKPEMVKLMARDPIILAMANPTPEIAPEEALAIRPAAILGTGRSDYPNQVNNVFHA